MVSGYSFIEVTGFTEMVKSSFGEDENYAESQSFLAERPDAGTVIP